MLLVRQPLEAFDRTLPVVPIRADRQRVAKRLWRAVADDGVEFGFEVTVPLSHGDTVHATASSRYVIDQNPEPVLEIPLDPSPAAAAVIGWAVGNMHCTIETRANCIFAPDDSALRHMLERIGLVFKATTAVFQPHRLASVVAHSHAPANAGAGKHPYIRAPRAQSAT